MMKKAFFAINFAAIGLFLALPDSECQAKDREVPENISLSKSQRKVVEDLGWPYSFMIIDGQISEEGQKGRIETWSYPKANKVYTFKNHDLTGTDELKISRKNLIRTDLRPTMFARKLDRGDVIEMLGKPSGGAKVEETEDGKIETLIYPEHNAAVVLYKDRFWAVKSNLVEESKSEKKKETKE